MFTCFAATNAQQPFQSKLHLCKPANATDSVYCGSYAVFENHKTKQGRKINLNIVVIPAISSSAKKSLIFYFDGGPGIAATKNVDFFSAKENPYRQHHDIVLVDIRGTGGSNPLHCISLQYKRNLQEQFEEMYPAEAVKSCFDSLSALADLSQYTTTNITTDIEEVRQWLGYRKIIAFGLSYGTRLTQEYMRRFPASVEAAVLWSPTSTGSRMPLYHALFAQATWNRLIADCKNDPLCKQAYLELQKDFMSLMRAMKSKPIIIKISDSVTVTLPWHAFQTKIRTRCMSLTH
jgi:pimeloyl-ACP methyl ester carboxylesterase